MSILKNKAYLRKMIYFFPICRIWTQIFYKEIIKFK